jgi:hypothetical protein
MTTFHACPSTSSVPRPYWYSPRATRHRSPKMSARYLNSSARSVAADAHPQLADEHHLRAHARKLLVDLRLDVITVPAESVAYELRQTLRALALVRDILQRILHRGQKHPELLVLAAVDQNHLALAVRGSAQLREVRQGGAFAPRVVEPIL